MHVRQATAADLSDIATVCADALFEDDLIEFLCPYRKKYQTDYRLGYLRRHKSRLYSGKRLLVAVSDAQDPAWDGKSKILGYASLESDKDAQNASQPGWIPWNALECQLLNVENFFIWHLKLDKSVSRSNMSLFQKAIAGDPFSDVGEFLDLSLLVVDPSHQRRGIGGALLRQAQKIALEERLPLVLFASPAGEGLYVKNGFQRLGGFNFGGNVVAEKMGWYPETVKVNDI